MDVAGVLNSVANSGQASQSSQSLANDFNNFLTLLTTQLQNQDPLDPMDSNEFTNQLVSFTGVEQQIRANQLAEQSLTLDVMGLTGLGLRFVGLEVERPGDTMIFDGQTPVQTSYTLPEEASEVTVSVTDEQGNVVYNTAGKSGSGEHAFIWDGKNNEGFTVEAGIYRINVAATSKDGDTSLNTGTRVPGIVEGIESGANGDILLNIGPDKVSITSVTKARIPTYATPEEGGDTAGDNNDPPGNGT